MNGLRRLAGVVPLKEAHVYSQVYEVFEITTSKTFLRVRRDEPIVGPP